MAEGASKPDAGRTRERWGAFAAAGRWSAEFACALAVLLTSHAILAELTNYEPPVPSAIWPVSGLAFALAWLFGLRSVVPAVVLSTVLWYGVVLGPVEGSILGAVINGIEPTIAVLALRQLRVARRLFSDVRSTVLWLLVATMLAPMVSATLHTATQLLSGEAATAAEGLRFWSELLVANFAGAATFAPPILLVVQHRGLRIAKRRRLESCGVVGFAALLSWLTFTEHAIELPFDAMTLMFLAMPSALYATFRLGPLSLAAIQAVFVCAAYFGTATGHGPFAGLNTHQQLFTVGVFLAVLVATPLLVFALLSERRRNAEALAQALSRERLYRSELDHRVRNNFGNILALIDLSASSATDLQHFAEAIADRVRTMSAAHNLLAGRPSEPIPLGELILRLTPDDTDGRIRLHGGDCDVHPSRIRALSMILAELFMNAKRHGGLLHEKARIDVKWTEDETEPHRCVLEWRESGVPMDASASKDGTGRKLVNGFARSELEGEAVWDFTPDGLHFTLRFKSNARPKPRIPHYASRTTPYAVTTKPPTTSGG